MTAHIEYQNWNEKKYSTYPANRNNSESTTLVEDARVRARRRAAENILKTEEICWMYEKNTRIPV